MEPETEAVETREPTDEDVEATLRDVRMFLDDPVALLERARAVLTTWGDASHASKGEC